MASVSEPLSILQVFREPSILDDPLQTETSEAKLETWTNVLPYILGTEGGLRALNSHGIPKIRRDEHVKFLRKGLEKMPGAYQAYDPARPFLIYWSLTALTLLGHDLSEYRERVVSTLSAGQNETGGFGGGHGQLSHIATSYAAVLSLAMVGGRAAFNSIDRKGMWEWLGRVKEPAGGIRMAVDAELDARGVYCAMSIIALLNLPLELPADAPARQAGLTSFLDNLPEWISKCQSYEGGLSARPGGEAHAAYTYCGLACLSIVGTPKDMLSRYLDLPSLISWLSARQEAPEGGFSGRTNKLVDSCYSHWVGSCSSFINEVLQSPTDLWTREGIIRYVICAAQNETGGMRDKPGKRPDAYHSCYALAGLGAMQHKQIYRSDITTQQQSLSFAFGWKAESDDGHQEFFDQDDLLQPLHPIFSIPYPAVDDFHQQATSKVGF